MFSSRVICGCWTEGESGLAGVLDPKLTTSTSIFVPVVESLMMSKSDSSLFWLVAWWSATLSVVSCDGDVSREAMMYAGASAITGKVISTIAVFHIRCLVDCGAFMVLYCPPLYSTVCSYII